MREEGFRQSEIAKQCGVSQPRVSRVLAGDFTVRSELADELCRRFGVEPLDEATEKADRAFTSVELSLRTLWDGTEGGARRINRLISAVKVVKAQTSKAG